jgi:hypothetical protein
MIKKIDPQLQMVFRNLGTTPELPTPVRVQVVQLLGQAIAELIRPSNLKLKEPRREPKN